MDDFIVDSDLDSDYNPDEESEFTDDIEDDPFYEPYLQNEQLMNIGRIIRYELSKMNETEEEESNEPPPPAIVVEEEVAVESIVIEENVVDSNGGLKPLDFKGIPRYRLSFMAVKYHVHTGITNIGVAFEMSNKDLIEKLCCIPRGTVSDCTICNYPLWDFMTTRCCNNSLCIHCVCRLELCPFCRNSL